MAITIDGLASHPAALPIVANWYFEQWGHKVANNSLEKTRERLREGLNGDRMPLCIVALENGAPCGAARLKLREMEIYPDREYWLGSVYVPPAVRGRAIAARLSERIAEMARERGTQCLYLQTERLDGGLYGRQGWKPLDQVHYNGLEVLVMGRTL